jgi:hypothetical protein
MYPPYAGARQLGHDAEILPGGGDGPEEGDGGGGSEEGTHLLLGVSPVLGVSPASGA